MGFLNDVMRLIGGAVGDNQENRPEDVLAVKRGLQQAGYFDADAAPEPHGYITADTDRAIRDFQKDNALKVDGYLLPGGETKTRCVRPNDRKEKARGFADLKTRSPKNPRPRSSTPPGE